MKNEKNSNLARFAALTTIAVILCACGNSKSNPNNTYSGFDISAQKTLARCNKTKDANFSISTASVVDQNGQLSDQWIKLKFNFLSTNITASGNVMKFFKWRVVGTETQLDNTPLPFAQYDMASGQTLTSQVDNLSTTQLNSNYGLYINLNDPYAQFQVIKIVIYNSSNQIVAQMNSLIPGFYANPLDYNYNSDGSSRSSILTQLHTLYGVDTSSWSAVQVQQSFDQYCF